MNLFALHAIIGGVMALAVWGWLAVSWQVWKKARRNIWPSKDKRSYSYSRSWDWAPYNTLPLWVIGPIFLPVGLAAFVVGYLLWFLCGGMAILIIKRSDRKKELEKEAAARSNEVAQLKQDLARAQAEVDSWVSGAARKQAEEIVNVPTDKTGNVVWDAFAAEIMRGHADTQ